MSQHDRELPIEYLDSGSSNISVAAVAEFNLPKIQRAIYILKKTNLRLYQKKSNLAALEKIIDDWRYQIAQAETASMVDEHHEHIHLQALINIFEILSCSSDLYRDRPKKLYHPYYETGLAIEFLLSRLAAQHHGLVAADSTVQQQLEFLNKLKFGKLAPPTPIRDYQIIEPKINFPDDFILHLPKITDSYFKIKEQEQKLEVVIKEKEDIQDDDEILVIPAVPVESLVTFLDSKIIEPSASKVAMVRFPIRMSIQNKSILSDSTMKQSDFIPEQIRVGAIGKIK
jgi:hypothetical protein